MIKLIEKMSAQLITESPFITCMHHVDDFPEGNENLAPSKGLEGRTIGRDFSGKNGFSMYHGLSVPGFPSHPHRGFETVTVVLEGVVDHFDSKGSCGRYSSGDVQWLTTGKGCQHSEMFPLVNDQDKNPLELFQIWLNLPSSSKFVEPYYKMLWNEEIPLYEHSSNNGDVKVKVIAGTHSDVISLPSAPDSWASDADNHVSIMLIEMDSGTSIKLPQVSSTLNRNLYFYRGDHMIYIGNDSIKAENRIKLSGSEEVIVTNGNEKSYLLLLEGEPILEPVVAYGPFVMNNEEEIKEAYNDYRQTAFGGWPWAQNAPTNDKNSGRFSKKNEREIERP